MQSVTELPNAYYCCDFFQNVSNNILAAEDLVLKCSHIVEKQFYETRMFRPAGCPGPMVMSFNLEQDVKGNFMDVDYSLEILQIFEPIILHLQHTLHLFSKRPFQLSINVYNDEKHSLAVFLHSSIILDFYKHPRENPYGLLVGEIDYGRAPTQSVLLEPNSLFVFSKNSFENYLHGVQQKEVDEFYKNQENKWYTWNRIPKELSLRYEQDEEYHSPICNFEMLRNETRELIEKEKQIQRGKRIAILIWSEEC